MDLSGPNQNSSHAAVLPANAEIATLQKQITREAESLPGALAASSDSSSSRGCKGHCLQVTNTKADGQPNTYMAEALSKIDEGSGNESPQHSPVSPQLGAIRSVFAADASTAAESPNSDSVIGLRPLASPSAGSGTGISSTEAVSPEKPLPPVQFNKSLAARQGLRSAQPAPLLAYTFCLAQFRCIIEDRPQIKPRTVRWHYRLYSVDSSSATNFLLSRISSVL